MQLLGRGNMGCLGKLGASIYLFTEEHAVIWHTGLPIFETETLCRPAPFPLCPSGEPVPRFGSCLPGKYGSIQFITAASETGTAPPYQVA